jgi:hypothetical protein
MKLREFDQADWDLFAGAVNPTVIGEFENESTGNSYVVIVDAYGLTLNRYDYEGYVDFVTIEMLPSQAELLAGSMEVDFDVIDKLIDDAQPATYSEV